MASDQYIGTGSSDTFEQERITLLRRLRALARAFFDASFSFVDRTMFAVWVQADSV